MSALRPVEPQLPCSATCTMPPNPLDRLNDADLYDRHAGPQSQGKCSVPGCPYHNVRPMCKGVFCEHHCQRLRKIRNNIHHAKQTGDKTKQIRWRIQEIMCRQASDAGHWQMLCDLISAQPEHEKRLNSTILSSIQHLADFVRKPKPKRQPHLWAHPMFQQPETRAAA